MKETIIQFGEGNFLRGFVDYFVQKMNDQGLYDGSVVVVKPTSRGNCDRFRSQNCKYNLLLRGIDQGREVCERTHITSISRIISPYEDFGDYLALAHNPDFRFIVSNTTEAGIVFDPDCRADDAPPSSFPAKLTLLLLERFNAGLGGFVLLPCELIDRGGDELKKCVLQYADFWSLGDDFKNWIESENSFCNTLVDRIVTGFPTDEAEDIFAELGYEDKLLDTAEIFHLWVIEGDYESELPLCKAGFNVIWTDDATPYKKRKVRVLNGAHTSMVCAALLAGVETVGECIDDADISAFMHKCLYDEILAVLGKTEDNIAFARAVEERFANPYIRHLLRSIVLNCVSKFAVRVLPSIMDYNDMFGDYPSALCFSLAALIVFYKTDSPNDDKAVEAFMSTVDVGEILSSCDLWGCDLSPLADIVQEDIRLIEDKGIRGAMQCIL